MSTFSKPFFQKLLFLKQIFNGFCLDFSIHFKISFSLQNINKAKDSYQQKI